MTLVRSLAVRSLLLAHLVLFANSIFQGSVLRADPDLPSAVVAIWSEGGADGAPHVRCTGVFVAPEVVLTAASCVLRGTPTGMVQHAACAHGARECPTLEPTSLKVLEAASLPERAVVADVIALEFRYSDPATMPQVCTGGAVCGRGWDIAALRVVQRCREQRCVVPLPLAHRAPVEGEPARIVGAGVDSTGLWALRERLAAISGVLDLQVRDSRLGAAPTAAPCAPPTRTEAAPLAPQPV